MRQLLGDRRTVPPTTECRVANCVLKHTPERTEDIHPRKNLYTMVGTALFMRAEKWRPGKCPPTEEGMNKMWSLHTTEYCPAIRNSEEALTQATM